MLSYIYADRDLLIELYRPYGGIVGYQISVCPVCGHHNIDRSAEGSLKFGLTVIRKNTTFAVIINDKVVFLEKDLTVIGVKIEIAVELSRGIVYIETVFVLLLIGKSYYAHMSASVENGSDLSFIHILSLYGRLLVAGIDHKPAVGNGIGCGVA